MRYRIERNLVIDAETGFIYQDQKGWGGSITSNLSFLKIINRYDGLVHLRSYASPAFKESFAALGFAYDLNQRNLPSFVGELSLGYGTNGFWPGVRLSYSQRLSEMEARVSAELAVEPYVVAQLPIRGYATYEQDLYAGKLISTLGLGFEEGQTEGFLKLEYQIALEQLNFE